MRYSARSVRGVPSAFVVGAFQVTVTEAASTLVPAATTATRMRTVTRSRAALTASNGVVEANSLLSPRDCALRPIQAFEISSAVAKQARAPDAAREPQPGMCALDESVVDAGQEGCHTRRWHKAGEISPTPADTPAHNVRSLTNASPAEQSNTSPSCRPIARASSLLVKIDGRGHDRTMRCCSLQVADAWPDGLDTG